MSKQITIKEIARKADVSIGTVDRVLHKRGRVSKVTEQKVLKIAEEGNYASNIYARNLKLSKTYALIAFLPPNNGYWDKHRKGIQKGVSEYAGLGLTVKEIVLDSFDERSILKKLDHCLEEKPDGLIFPPFMLTDHSPVFGRLTMSKMPYVFLDSNHDNSGNLTFIGQDAFRSGRTAGQLLDLRYSEDFRVYILTLEHKDLLNKTVKNRIQGVKDFFSEKEGVTLESVNLEEQQLTIDDLKELIMNQGKPAHVLIPNSKSFLVAEQLASVRSYKRLLVVGYDLIDENMACLKNGSLDYVIDQRPEDQGYMAVQSLYKHLILKTTVPEIQNMSIDILTKENLPF